MITEKEQKIVDAVNVLKCVWDSDRHAGLTIKDSKSKVYHIEAGDGERS